MSIRVLVNGALGKMGRLACQTLEDSPDFDLVGQLGRADDLSSSIAHTKAQVVIDLTRADVAYDNALTIIKNQASPVIGTSGLTLAQIKHLTTLCEAADLGGIVVPNFSIGAVLMMHCAAIASRYLANVEIIETHHPQKFDAPSGTALKTAEQIAKYQTTPSLLPHSKESIPGVRGGLYKDIPIHSLRLPGVIAKQDVILGHLGETLTISHNTTDRKAFMAGMILCCQKVRTIRTLVNGLEHFLSLPTC
ncbi:MAG TPA: 4-hydroxy-tetrahydrodipicolinate reductase [Legionellales bacterium]|nr:4-hydroxy-tetrahydrodipicolinate reductase [Legionellales bacterium]|tara:strand:+ start:5006 stop:5752 length:747 start_codon:yes stop_codon:yes gene_type:complete